MVSTHFESNMWRAVARPVAKPKAMTKQPPSTPPKPGGKVFVYVYEAPGDPPVQYPVSVTGSGTSPAKSQLIYNGFPEAERGMNENDTIVRKLRHRAKKAGEGYKLLADVNNKNLKSSSRGGRMFMNQKMRMEDYTSRECSGKVKEVEDDPISVDHHEFGGERSTPWNMSKVSSAAVNYIPATLYHSNFSKERKKRKGQILAPLRSPPPEWRAKVESDFRISNFEQTLPIRRWKSVDESHNPQSSRSESAPLMTSENLTNQESMTDDDREKPGSVIGMWSQSKNAAVNFDAKKHRKAPHRKQGVRAGREMFITTPQIQYDFNARPVGWSKAYAKQY